MEPGFSSIVYSIVVAIELSTEASVWYPIEQKMMNDKYGWKECENVVNH